MSSSSQNPPASGAKRPFIGLRWECCGLYSRVVRHVSGKFYAARCPGCSKAVRIQVGEGGTNSRFFTVR